MQYAPLTWVSSHSPLLPPLTNEKAGPEFAGVGLEVVGDWVGAEVVGDCVGAEVVGESVGGVGVGADVVGDCVGAEKVGDCVGEGVPGKMQVEVNEYVPSDPRYPCNHSAFVRERIHKATKICHQGAQGGRMNLQA